MWYDPLKLPIAFLTRHFYMILNQHKISNKMEYNMPLLIQFGDQIVFEPQLTFLTLSRRRPLSAEQINGLVSI